MHRLLILASSLVLLAAAAPGAPVPPGAGKMPVYYYATKVGTKLVHDEQGKEVTYVVTKVEKKDGVLTVTTDRVLRDGKTTHSETVVVSARGLAWTRCGGREVDPPAYFLRLPVGPGQRWENEFVGALSAPAVDKVEVPAGVFEAVRMEYTANLLGPMGGEREARSWYAQDVGLVKTTLGGETIVALKGLTPGKD